MAEVLTAEAQPSGSFVSVKDADGFEVQSNTGSVAELRDELQLEEPKADGEAPALEPRESDGRFKRRNNRHDNREAAVREAKGKQLEAERKAQELETQLAELRKPPVVAPTPAPVAAQPIAAPTPAPQRAVPPIADDPEPTADQFPPEQFDKFIDARARWATRQELKAHDQQRTASTRQEQLAQSRHQVSTQFATRMTAAMAADPTLQARVAASPFANVQPLMFVEPDEHGVYHGTYLNAIADVLIKSDTPEKLIAHFESHPDDLQRLSTLPPDEFFRQMGRIEARFDAAPAPSGPARPQPISQARPPIKPLSGPPPVATDDPPGDDASDAVHEAYWKSRRRQFR